MILLHFNLPEGREYEVGPNEYIQISLKWIEPDGTYAVATSTGTIPEGSRIIECTLENSI